MVRTRKKKGYNAESIVREYYKDKGYTLLAQNFTIRGGEIDLIVESSRARRFIEVKCVDYIDEYMGYITYNKTKALKKCLLTFNSQHPTAKFITIDVVFVRKNRIVHIFEDITQ